MSHMHLAQAAPPRRPVQLERCADGYRFCKTRGMESQAAKKEIRGAIAAELEGCK